MYALMTARMNTTKATINTIRILVFNAFKDTPPRAAAPTIFQPVYPTVLTVTARRFPLYSS